MNIKNINNLVNKSDNPEKMQKIIEQLKESGFTDAFNTGRELKHLPEIINNDEIIKGAASGMEAESTDSILIVVTNKRIILENKKLLFGSHNTSIPLNKINTVSYNTGIILGSISFTNGADTLKIKNIQKEDAQPLAKAIKTVVNDYHFQNINHQQTNHNSNSTITADKLREMKQLVQEGIITQNEFDAAKKKYLGI